LEMREKEAEFTAKRKGLPEETDMSRQLIQQPQVSAPQTPITIVTTSPQPPIPQTQTEELAKVQLSPEWYQRYYDKYLKPIIEGRLGPQRTVLHDREVESVLDNYKQFQPNWNAYLDWHYRTLDKTLVYPNASYMLDLSRANRYLAKLRSQMIPGSIAAAQAMKQKLDERAYRMVIILMWAMSQPEKPRIPFTPAPRQR